MNNTFSLGITRYNKIYLDLMSILMTVNGISASDSRIWEANIFSQQQKKPKVYIETTFLLPAKVYFYIGEILWDYF